jgi:hypothetical protein
MESFRLSLPRQGENVIASPGAVEGRSNLPRGREQTVERGIFFFSTVKYTAQVKREKKKQEKSFLNCMIP